MASVVIKMCSTNTVWVLAYVFHRKVAHTGLFQFVSQHSRKMKAITPLVLPAGILWDNLRLQLKESVG